MDISLTYFILHSRTCAEQFSNPVRQHNVCQFRYKQMWLEQMLKIRNLFRYMSFLEKPSLSKLDVFLKVSNQPCFLTQSAIIFLGFWNWKLPRPPKKGNFSKKTFDFENQGFPYLLLETHVFHQELFASESLAQKERDKKWRNHYKSSISWVGPLLALSYDRWALFP